jgi:hypothetical protein
VEVPARAFLFLAKKHHSPFLANVVWLAVVFFGIVATLQQLEILEFVTEAASDV